MKATKENYELRRQISLMMYYLNTGCVIEMRRKASSIKTNDRPYPAAQYLWAICTAYPVKIYNKMFEYRVRGGAFFPIIGEEYEFRSDPSVPRGHDWYKAMFIGYGPKGGYACDDGEDSYEETQVREIKEVPETQEEACARCGLPWPSSNPYCFCKNTAAATWNFDNFSKNITLEG